MSEDTAPKPTNRSTKPKTVKVRVLPGHKFSVPNPKGGMGIKKREGEIVEVTRARANDLVKRGQVELADDDDD